jgi:signal transduction histidine kinase
VVVLLAALAALFGMSKAVEHLPTAETSTLPEVIRALAAGLFLIAGVLRLVRWRLTADPETARAATALIVLGAALATLPLVGPLLQQSPELERSAPAARLLFVVPLLVLLTLRAHPRHGDGHPLTVTATLLICWVAVSVAASQLSLPGAVMANPAVWQTAEGVVSLGWALLAARTWRSSRAHRRPVDALVTCALLLMATCEAAKAITMTHAPTAFVASLVLQLIVAIIAVCVACTELREAVDADAARTDGLALSLLQARAELAHSEHEQERFHDARSAVAGLVGAARLLTEPATGLDAARLHGLMSAELERLQASLSADADAPITTFELRAALQSVVLSHRLAGGVARTDLGTAAVIGRPGATPTGLATLPANARHHAPGARVDIRTEQTGSSVLLIVEDDGPGIPAAERVLVMGRGVRGSTTGPGSGLGLYTAAEAMAAQSGSLQVLGRPGGGTRVVLTFRSAQALSAQGIAAQGIAAQGIAAQGVAAAAATAS